MNDAQGAIGSANNISMPCNQLLLHCIIFFTVKDQLKQSDEMSGKQVRIILSSGGGSIDDAIFIIG